jgi:hypothetical protein
MTRRWFGYLSFGLLALAGLSGCVEDNFKPRTSNVPVQTPNLPAGSQANATWVDSIGRKILAANKDLGFQPTFFTLGKPELVLYHQGTEQICISDGLVNKCKTDAELAAVICSELGKMVAEAQSQGRTVRPDREPLLPAVGGDSVGVTPDRTALAEQAMWEKKNPPPRGYFTSDRDPRQLAQQYLVNTDRTFSADDLVRVSALVRQAANTKPETPGGSRLEMPNLP